METMHSGDSEIRMLRRELALLRSDPAGIRQRMALNAAMLDLALWMAGLGMIFVVAMKVT